MSLQGTVFEASLNAGIDPRQIADVHAQMQQEKRMDEKWMVVLLRRIERQLEAWANESRTGGWSTHQVQPMRKLADEIRLALSGSHRV